jgi:hypothetical protein
MIKGQLTWWNREIFERAVTDDDARTAFATIALPPQGNSSGTLDGETSLDPRQNVTLGQWADSRK